MSDQFNYYEKEIESCLSKIKESSDEITNNINSSNISVNSELFDKAFDLISKSEKIIKQMNLEITTSPNMSEDCKTRINDYTNFVNMYKKNIKKLQEKTNIEKNTLLFDSKPNDGGLIQNEELAYSGNAKLQEGRRILASTEDAANKIMSSMEEQTNQMKSVNVKIHGMNENLDNSNSLLNSMQSIVNKNKKIFVGFGIALGTILVIIITIKVLFR